jgi:hypothetical protein
MSPKRFRLEIDRDIYEALAARAKGFETPNAVLRRLLKLEPKS